MQNSEGPSRNITKELAGITDKLESIINTATPETKAGIDWARQILINTAVIYDNHQKGLIRNQSSDNPGYVTRQFDIRNFVNVEIDCAYFFEIVRGDSFTIAVRTEERILEQISVNQSGDTLRLSLKPVTLTARPILHARITMPVLKRLRQSAATKGMVSGFRSDDPFDLYLSGASSVLLDFECPDARLEISGASVITGRLEANNADVLLSGASRGVMSGRCHNLSLSAWGAAELDLRDFYSEEGAIFLKGASQAIVRISKKMDYDLTGASHLDYIGDPNLRELTLTGTSILRKVG